IRQLSAYLIGSGEVARLLCRGAIGNQLFYLGVGKAGSAGGGFEHVEKRVEIMKYLESARAVQRKEIAMVEGGVGFAHELENGSERFRSVQIVVERGSKATDR